MTLYKRHEMLKLSKGDNMTYEQILGMEVTYKEMYDKAREIDPSLSYVRVIEKKDTSYLIVNGRWYELVHEDAIIYNDLEYLTCDGELYVEE